MKTIFGNTDGLKHSQLKRLQNLYKRRIPPEYVISYELARDISSLSWETGRQVALLANRAGKIIYVILGDANGVVIPDTPDYRTLPGKLKGLRCVHTHLDQSALSKDDLTDLSLLRLDAMAAVEVNKNGGPGDIHMGHIMPQRPAEPSYRILPPINPHDLDTGFLELIQALESELDQTEKSEKFDPDRERALLVSVTTFSRKKAEESLHELQDLAVSGGITVIDTILQIRNKPDPRFLMGRGKLRDITLAALEKGASLIIFDQDLNPSQIRSITNHVELKIIDRTQLILDIFAQRARTREGKLQVELAQLKYMLPRLVAKNTAMSRLTGGIGGRGPGETKLEINRRRVRERIARLAKDLAKIQKQRKQQRSEREKKGVPIVSIIGYTNAGKSTLLNTLTKSDVLAESRLFATLDPTSRRLRLPRDKEIIITDTVGFIRDLPKDLIVAFRATLEELEQADLLLHVIDVSNPRRNDQIQSVERILSDLDLDHIPMIRVLNKQDILSEETVQILSDRYEGVAVSAIKRKSLIPLVERIEGSLFLSGSSSESPYENDSEGKRQNDEPDLR